ncbi:unnamed protein product [Trichobilharzia szidati]|nr:unnamed protein product [Trichobilharzia szidati]
MRLEEMQNIDSRQGYETTEIVITKNNTDSLEIISHNEWMNLRQPSLKMILSRITDCLQPPLVFTVSRTPTKEVYTSLRGWLAG